MSEQNSERVITPMPPSLVRAIDDFRYKMRIPSRAEAIRQLIEAGLQVQKGEKPDASPKRPKRV
jgi:metal-responsive CopG/Arc/MetJ family transcriptional regulator